MTKAELKILLDKYRDGSLSADEKASLNRWYLHRAKNAAPLEDADVFKSRMAEMDAALASYIRKETEPKRLRLWPRRISRSAIWKVAAAVAAITLGVWFYYAARQSRLDVGNPGLAMNDIAPGKNTATLTLANGKVINLDTNKTSVVVTDSVKTTTMLTASTPRGGQYQVVLPDGTKVWLNADSKLEFPSQFIGKQRKVILNGEGYFEVAKDKKHPFIVESAGTNGRAGQQVEVLGTHFNINSYADEGSTKTTLLEGSVSVTSLRGRTEASRGNLPGRGPSNTLGEATILKPGQQSVITDNNRIAAKQVNPSEVIGWKEGEFRFSGQALGEIMKSVARWYDVEVHYTDDVAAIALTGSISRYENVSKVLEMLQSTKEVKFKVEGRKLYVSKQ